MVPSGEMVNDFRKPEPLPAPPGDVGSIWLRTLLGMANDASVPVWTLVPLSATSAWVAFDAVVEPGASTHGLAAKVSVGLVVVVILPVLSNEMVSLLTVMAVAVPPTES